MTNCPDKGLHTGPGDGSRTGPGDGRGDAAEAPPSGRLEDLCVDLASDAARFVWAARLDIGRVDAKSTETDLVTDVDRASEQRLTDRLRVLRPHDGVVGEEGAGRAGSTGVRWVLDPIDGTVNFVLGLPHYAVSVAAEVDGTILAGAVADPSSGAVFRARVGGGAHVRTDAGDERLYGPREVPLRRAVIGTGFAYDAAVRRRQIEVVAALLPQIADVRRLGAAALDLCYLAAGRLDAFFEAGLNQWDYAAGALIATEAGCVTTGLHGRRAGRRFLAAARPALAGELFGALESLAADEVTGEGRGPLD